MKKGVVFLFLQMVCLTMMADVTYTIKGLLPAKYNGASITLTAMAYTGGGQVDTAVVKNGEFIMTGIVDMPKVGMIFVRNGDESIFSDIIIGDDGTLNVSESDGQMVITGGTRQPLIAELKARQKAANLLPREEYRKLVDETMDKNTTKERVAEIGAIMDKDRDKGNALMKRFVIDHCDNVVGAFYFTQCSYCFTNDEYQELKAKAKPEFLNNPDAMRFLDVLDHAQNRAVGAKFTDFEMADRDGKMHRLSEYVGKGRVVMIDCWASWCGPCRAEMPEVKKIYAKFHDKGFDIVGTSCDSQKKNWTDAIDTLQLPWYQLSDLKGWDCEAARLYGVNAVPCTILFDGNGIVIGNNLHGADLEKKLEEIFAKAK